MLKNPRCMGIYLNGGMVNASIAEVLHILKKYKIGKKRGVKNDIR